MSGGEPTLSKHWEAVGAAASGRGIAVNMITNAARADRELVRRAKDAGLVSIAASLDGLEDTHDRHRGLPGSFKRVMALIEDCQAVGLPVGVITTLQKRNVRELDQLEALLAGKKSMSGSCSWARPWATCSITATSSSSRRTCSTWSPRWPPW